ncbi:FUSC family protein [Pseudomonas sp. PDM26]|nr:FUSC family protein [Pseudomonas sp. PDM26]MBV7550260.1 FUSC family protein [Pseudomonas sp. PDM26]
MPTPLALKFAIKTLLAGGLALWLAFRFDLQQPQWALMTVFIVSQPLSGMVVSKSIFRLAGTLVGAVMSVLITGLFAQAPWLFLLAISLWLGLCTVASTSLHNFVSYAFVLSGYTVVIIGLPMLIQPLHVFDQAVARATEISLGIICASLFSALIWPQRVEHNLEKQARMTLLASMQAAKMEISTAVRETKTLLAALSKIVATDVLRDHARFEGFRGRHRARVLRVLSRELLSLLRMARGVALQRHLLSTDDVQRLQPWFEQVAEQLEHPDAVAISILRDRLAQTSAQEQRSNVVRCCLERCSALLLNSTRAQQSMSAVTSGEIVADDPGTLSWHRDGVQALFYGLRSTLVVLGLSAFWYASAWPSAIGAIVLSGVLCSLFANYENGAAITMGMTRGFLYAIPIAAIVTQWMLPEWNGFPLLCLALGVPLFFGALGMAEPRLTPTPTAFVIQFIILVTPSNLMHYDFSALLNSAIGSLVGGCFAVLVFRLLTLPPGWFNRRLLNAVCNDLARLTRYPLAQADNWFGGRMADRLLRLAQLSPGADSKHWNDGLLAMDLGNELIQLRTCLSDTDSSLRNECDRFLAQLGQRLAFGPTPESALLLSDLSQHLNGALQQTHSQASQLAQASLVEMQTLWEQWCQREDERGIA